jgi:hypothetical protein
VFVKVEGKNLKVAGVSALYFPAEWQANWQGFPALFALRILVHKDKIQFRFCVLT